MESRLAHTLYGEPVSGQRPAHAPVGSRMASASAPFIGERAGKCVANGDTCKGPKVRGKELCIGHLRAEKKGKDVS